MSLFPAVVETSCPFKVKSSTTTLVKLVRSVIAEPPNSTAVPPMVTLSFANLALVTPEFVS